MRSAIEMPKQKVSTASRLRQYVTQFRENVFSTDGTILFCKVWEVKKHLRALGNVNKIKVSQLLLKETEVCLFSTVTLTFFDRNKNNLLIIQNK